MIFGTFSFLSACLQSRSLSSRTLIINPHWPLRVLDQPLFWRSSKCPSTTWIWRLVRVGDEQKSASRVIWRSFNSEQTKSRSLHTAEPCCTKKPFWDNVSSKAADPLARVSKCCSNIQGTDLNRWCESRKGTRRHSDRAGVSRIKTISFYFWESDFIFSNKLKSHGRPMKPLVAEKLHIMDAKVQELDTILSKLVRSLVYALHLLKDIKSSQLNKTNVVVENVEVLINEAHRSKGWTWIKTVPLWSTWPMEHLCKLLPLSSTKDLNYSQMRNCCLLCRYCMRVWKSERKCTLYSDRMTPHLSVLENVSGAGRILI